MTAIDGTHPYKPVGAQRYLSQPRLGWQDDDGPHVVTVSGTALLGSAQSSQLVIRHRTVSRVHAEMQLRGDGLWVRDLNSRNGTWIDSVRVSGGLLSDCATLRVGAVEIKVSYDEGVRTPVESWPHSQFGPLLGESSVMRELFAVLARYSETQAPVVIHGETGTGKELVAKAVHEASRRARNPFVVIDCAALAETLLDAELFGHAKGAFTGATAARLGAFEAAEGGTVFLDEIGEIPLALQPKLLRVLESGTIRRVGEVEHRSVDVRVLSATHRDLAAMVAKGLFREDLFFRISILPVTVPPLRERRSDIDYLLRHFGSRSSTTVAFSAAALRELETYPWPGNVRELRNFLERAKALGPDAALRMLIPVANQPAGSLAPAGVLSSPPAPLASTEENAALSFDDSAFDADYRTFRTAWLDDGERRYLTRLLERFGRDTVSAADAAGVDRSYLYRMMRKYAL